MKITVLLVSNRPRTGAFITTLDLVDVLRAAGHDVTINPAEPIEADLTISHLGDPRARSVHGRHFLMVHGANAKYRRRLPRYDRVWFPSNALAAWYLNPPDRVVVPPIIDPYRYLVEPGEHVTLAAGSVAKGSSRLAQIAKALPNVPFLVAHEDPPKEQPILAMLPNVTLIPRCSDVRDLLSQTKLLLMPLGGLSWGRTAVEASVSGIPTIATGEAGVREAMGDGAMYISATQPRRWVSRIERLMTEPELYSEAVDRAQARGDRLDVEEQTTAFLNAVEGTA